MQIGGQAVRLDGLNVQMELAHDPFIDFKPFHLIHVLDVYVLERFHVQVVKLIMLSYPLLIPLHLCHSLHLALGELMLNIRNFLANSDFCSISFFLEHIEEVVWLVDVFVKFGKARLLVAYPAGIVERHVAHLIFDVFNCDVHRSHECL